MKLDKFDKFIVHFDYLMDPVKVGLYIVSETSFLRGVSWADM